MSEMCFASTEVTPYRANIATLRTRSTGTGDESRGVRRPQAQRPSSTA